MRLVVIYNPKAGARGWSKGAIQERLEAAGHEPALVSTKSEWREALSEPVDAVVAAGGDGTVHKVAKALAGTRRPLALLPLGTANNIARAFGYAPGSDPFLRVGHWGEIERPLRIECARSDAESLPFLEVLGAGAFAQLLAGDDGKKKRLPLASLISARRKLSDRVLAGPVLDARIALDGNPLEGRFVLLACLRIPSFGPALWLAPDQQPDAATLTAVGVRNDQREPFAWWLATGEGDVTTFTLGRGRRLEIHADGPIHADDRLLADDDGRARTLMVGGAARTVRLMV